MVVVAVIEYQAAKAGQSEINNIDHKALGKARGEWCVQAGNKYQVNIYWHWGNTIPLHMHMHMHIHAHAHAHVCMLTLKFNANMDVESSDCTCVCILVWCVM